MLVVLLGYFYFGIFDLCAMGCLACYIYLWLLCGFLLVWVFGWYGCLVSWLMVYAVEACLWVWYVFGVAGFVLVSLRLVVADLVAGLAC